MIRPDIFYKRLDVLLGAVVLILLGYLVFLDFRAAPPAPTAATPTSTPVGPIYLNALDGSPVTSTDEELPPVVGVMIDNHPDARPESGLAEASVVYEVPVEGSITRYFAIFPLSATVAKVGPVRSARPYFLDWLEEYGDSSYWHSGGSPEALSDITARHIWDANEFYYGSFYWRSADRAAPHNLYTSSNNWQAFAARYGGSHSSTTWQGWNFTTSTPTGTPVGEFSLSYASDYHVGWKFNAASSSYVRLINNEPEQLDDDSEVTASNIVVQEMSMQITDSEGRLKLGTIGTGVAKIFRDGTMVRGTWKKESATARTRFYDASGNELDFVPGHTWIEVVPMGTSLIITN